MSNMYFDKTTNTYNVLHGTLNVNENCKDVVYYEMYETIKDAKKGNELYSVGTGYLFLHQIKYFFSFEFMLIERDNYNVICYGNTKEELLKAYNKFLHAKGEEKYDLYNFDMECSLNGTLKVIEL